MSNAEESKSEENDMNVDRRQNETSIEEQRSLTLRTRFSHNRHQLADHEENQID